MDFKVGCFKIPGHRTIAQLAFAIWDRKGRPSVDGWANGHGSMEENWAEAVREATTLLAHQLWVAQGYEHGHDVAHWVAASRLIEVSRIAHELWWWEGGSSQGHLGEGPGQEFWDRGHAEYLRRNARAA